MLINIHLNLKKKEIQLKSKKTKILHPVIEEDSEQTVDTKAHCDLIKKIHFHLKKRRLDSKKQ